MWFKIGLRLSLISFFLLAKYNPKNRVRYWLDVTQYLKYLLSQILSATPWKQQPFYLVCLFDYDSLWQRITPPIISV